MFINSIDKFVSKYLDTFYNTTVKNLKETNIDILVNKITLFTEKILPILSKEFDFKFDNKNQKLINVLNIYLLHYYFLHSYLSSKSVTYEQLSEFLFKNIKTNLYYFNSTTNKDLLEYILLINDIKEKKKNDDFLFKKKESSQIWKLIITKNINITDPHNLIKLILIKFFHIQNREQIFKLLTVRPDDVYSEIDIVVPREAAQLNYEMIENTFIDKNNSFITRIFNLLLNNQTISIQKKNKIQNIISLVQSKYIYLICDDFLTYHYDTFRYDSEFSKAGNDRQSKRRINIAVNRVYKASKLYNKDIEPTEKEEILAILNNTHRMAMAINEYEDIKILKRLYDDGTNKITHDHYIDFMAVREYPYHNFINLEYSSLRLKFPRSVQLIRNCSFKYLKSKSSSSADIDIQMRNSGQNLNTDIIGFCIPSKIKNKFKIKHIVLDYEINLQNINKILNDINKNKKSYCFIFKDNVNSEYIINILNKVYSFILNKLFERIFYKINRLKSFELYDYFSLLDSYNKKYINISKDNEFIHTNFINIIYDKINIKKKYISDPKSKLYISFTHNDIMNSYKQIKIVSNPVCQHRLLWQKLKMFESNPDIYEHLEFEFMKTFVDNIYNGDQVNYTVCKSCGEVLNLWNYVADGDYDDNNNFISSYSNKNTPLVELQEYENYGFIIEFIHKQISQISEKLDLSFHGINKTTIRDSKVKDIFNIMKFNYINIEQQIKENQKSFRQYINDYNIHHTKLDAVDIDLITLNTFSNNEKTIQDKSYINNFIAYIIAVLVFYISDTDIIMIKTQTKFNIGTYNKLKNKLFANLQLIYNRDEQLTTPILKYDVLCYLIFMLSSYFFINKLWHTSDNKQGSIDTHLSIIHTVVDVINRILLIDSNNINTLYDNNIYSSRINIISRLSQILQIRFLTNLNNIYNSIQIYKRIVVQFDKIKSNKEVNEIMGNISSLYKPSDIKSFEKDIVYNNKPLFFNSKKILYNRILNLNLKLYKFEMNEQQYDKYIMKLKEYLCNNYSKTYQLNFCNIQNSKDLNNNDVYLVWKNIETMNYSKINKYKNEKQDYFKNRVKSLNYQNSNISINGLVDRIRTLIYSEYKLKINTETVYIMHFYYNLKKRIKPLIIQYNELSSINIPSFILKDVLVYNSSSDQVYYYFNKDSLGFIGYKLYKSKDIIPIKTDIHRFFIQTDYSFYTKLKYLGLTSDKYDKEYSLTELNEIIKTQFYNIKSYIRLILKYIYILKNDKTLLKNENHEYLFLGKFIKDYNLHNIYLNKDNVEIFKNWNYIFNNFNKKYTDFKTYLLDKETIIQYFIVELNNLIDLNKSQQSEISYFIYEIINYLIDKQHTFNNLDFNQQLAHYYIEIEQANVSQLLKAQIGDDNYKNYMDIQKTNEVETNDKKSDEIEEDGYDMTDNDNDEDDTIESHMS